MGTDANEGAFSVKELGEGFCFAGRRDNGEKGYDALLGFCRGEECRVFTFGGRGDDYSYSVESYGDSCLALVTTFTGGDMDITLVVYGPDGIKRFVSFGGEGRDMGWFLRKVEGGYLVVGGVLRDDWDILVIKFDDSLKPLWHLLLGTGADEYAYSAVEQKSVYYIVGRTDFRGNWDGFVLSVSAEGRPGGGWIVGSEKKDYLRYIGLAGSRLMAVGRTETEGESDILVYYPLEGSYKLLDGGGYDYGRAFVQKGSGLALVGDHSRGGDLQGFVLFTDQGLKPLEAYSVGGEDVESLRFIDGPGLLVAGYTYSFSLDNDLMVGGFTGSCWDLVKPISFVNARGRIESGRFPYLLKDYVIVKKDLELVAQEISMNKRLSCPQE